MRTSHEVNRRPSPKLEVRDLRLVCAIAEEGGPTRAASRLHLSQSAVSHRLTELESRLGVLLFTRVRRRLHLTRAGAHLVEYSKTALQSLATVEREVIDAGRHGHDRLRISTECFTCYHWLPVVLQALQKDYPGVAVRIVVEATRRPIEALQKGELELAIVSSKVRDQALMVERLFEDDWIVLLPKTHPLTAKRFISAKALSAHTVFAHEASAQDVLRMRALLEREGTELPQMQVVPLTEAIVELVGAELGVGLMSRWAATPYVESGRVVHRRFTRAGLKEQWSAAYRKEDAARPALLRMVELIKTRARRLHEKRP